MPHQDGSANSHHPRAATTAICRRGRVVSIGADDVALGFVVGEALVPGEDEGVNIPPLAGHLDCAALL